MKKTLAVFTMLIMILGIFTFTNKVSADEKAIDTKTESKLVEIKETQTKSLEDYQKKYGSESYGLVAYILNLVRIYSIPVCFVGIAIGGIYQVIGIRKLDERDRGFGIMIGCITVLVITQLLPLIFAIVVKGWRG